MQLHSGAADSLETPGVQSSFWLKSTGSGNVQVPGAPGRSRPSSSPGFRVCFLKSRPVEGDDLTLLGVTAKNQTVEFLLDQFS